VNKQNNIVNDIILKCRRRIYCCPSYDERTKLLIISDQLDVWNIKLIIC